MRSAATFDAAWYSAVSVEDGRRRIPVDRAWEHFRRRGLAEGLAPNPRFDGAWYLRSHPDVAGAVAAGRVASAWDHFCLTGRHEGRHPNGLVVDEAWYISHYADAAASIEDGACRDACEHYLEHGAGEGRSPHAAFDERWYLRQHPEVRRLIDSGRFVCGYHYLLERGLAAGHQPHPLFDEAVYLRENPALRKVLSPGEGYRHLIDNGLFEGRRWKTVDPAMELRNAAAGVSRARLDDFLASSRRITFSPPPHPRVSVVVVLFNRADLTLGCLEALQRVDTPTFELIVVDNASSDETSELLERTDGVVVLTNDDNRGFTLATNQGAAVARGELLLLLNNDTEIFPSTLQAAVDRLLSERDIGAVGARVIGIDGRLQEAGSIVWRYGSTDGYGRGDDPASGAYLFPRDVDYCSGVFLLLRKEDFDSVGGLDPAFAPAYFEEADLCFRLRERGLRCTYEPQATLLHVGWGSLPDEDHLARMLARNRSVFRRRYRELLDRRPEPSIRAMFAASDLRRFRGRVLLVDDLVPLAVEGSGAPRTREILLGLCELGYAATMFATNPGRVDLRDIRRELAHPSLEVLAHLDRSRFRELWELRRGSYDVVIVSRWHNLEALLQQGFDPEAEEVRLIYDAECVSALRGKQRHRLGLGEPAKRGATEDTEGGDRHERTLDAAAELELARRAPEIWAVSSREAELLAGPDTRVTVISHAVERASGAPGPTERAGVLFVGRLDEPWNPNVDALQWYLGTVHPLVEQRLGVTPVTVVGDASRLTLPETPSLRLAGRVDDLQAELDRHRLFVAPTRFAAGIPLKILTAAAGGLPVVASDLLASQLGWRDGEELLTGGDNHPSRFADAVVRLYRDEALWRRLREGSWERVAHEHSREALRRALEAALAPLPRRAEPPGPGPTAGEPKRRSAT